MKTTVKTLKGWANNSNLLFSQNTKNDIFNSNLKKYINENLQGFKKLSCFDSLKGRQANEKIVIKGYYWRGSWNDPTKEIICIYYR